MNLFKENRFQTKDDVMMEPDRIGLDWDKLEIKTLHSIIFKKQQLYSDRSKLVD